MLNEDGSVGLPVNEPDFTPVSVALDKLYVPRFALVNVAFVRSAVEPRMFPATSPHPEGNVGAEVATTAPDETLVNVAPERFVEVSVAPRNFTLVRFAPVRLADVRFAFFSHAVLKFAFERLVLVKIPLVKTAPEKLALVNVAFEKFVVLSARLERLILANDAPERFAPGPIK
jgi:hypothetical protein